MPLFGPAIISMIGELDREEINKLLASYLDRNMAIFTDQKKGTLRSLFGIASNMYHGYGLEILKFAAVANHLKFDQHDTTIRAIADKLKDEDTEAARTIRRYADFVDLCRKTAQERGFGDLRSPFEISRRMRLTKEIAAQKL